MIPMKGRQAAAAADDDDDLAQRTADGLLGLEMLDDDEDVRSMS